MAHSTTNPRTGFSIAGVLRSVGEAFYNGMTALAEARSRSKQIEFLQSLSDEDLKKRGISRDQIVYHVFSDSVWR